MSAVAPSSTTSPISIITILSLICRTTLRLWVTIKICNLILSWISAKRFRISPWIDTSNPAVGSSAINNLGFCANALATQTRRAWPPESSWGYRLENLAGSPTKERRFCTSWPWSLALPTPLGSASLIIFSTVILGLKLPMGSWKMRAISFRADSKSFRLWSSIDLPKKLIVPVWQETSLIMERINVVFPDPLSPTIASVSPAKRFSDTLFTAVMSLEIAFWTKVANPNGLGNFTVRFLICKIGARSLESRLVFASSSSTLFWLGASIVGKCRHFFSIRAGSHFRSFFV